MRSIRRKVREAVLERDGHACRYCGVSLRYTLEPDTITGEPGMFICHGNFPEMDHVIPRSKGGRSTVDNLVASCSKCNRSKWNRTPEEWGADVR